MILASFLCCIIFAIFGVSCDFQDLYTTPVCEKKGPQDVYLDFFNKGLNKLSKSSVFNSSIKCLNYAGNNINEIDKDAFDDVPELYYLNLAYNPINYQNFIKTAILNLETLILDGPFRQSYYRQFDAYNRHKSENELDEWLLCLPNLKKLSLRYCGASSGCINFWLSTLNVPKLTHLYLPGNELTTVTILAKFPNLTYLNLAYNKMASMSGSSLKNLEYLSIIRNVCGKFCKPHSMTLHGMQNLKWLSLENNVIENIDSDAFSDSENLLFLNLAGNKIRKLKKKALDNLTELRKLILNRNNLKRVPDVCTLQELQVLALNENKIMAIDEMTFCHMPKLNVVYLRENGIVTIGNMAFNNVPNLAWLDLSWNTINCLPKKWISPENRLKVLFLDNNKFNDIRNLSLGLLHNLDALSLQHNPFKKISTRMLKKLGAHVIIAI